MRQFYLIYEIIAPVAQYLTWSHIQELLPIKDNRKMLYYALQIKKYINYIDKNIKDITHDKTIGIIIVRNNNKFVMEYCSDPRIFRTTYMLVSN